MKYATTIHPAAIVFIVLLLHGCSLFGEDLEAPSYPTIVPALSDQQRNALQQQFESMHEGTVCTPLNEFGFTEWSLTACIEGDFFKPDTTRGRLSEALLVSRARQFLQTYSAFTGVTDTSQLEPARASSGGILRFRNQRYQGLEVKYTEILVEQDAEGVFAVGGNWYPDIFIPATDAVGKQQAQQRLIGTELTFANAGGMPQTFRVTEDAFPEDARVDKIVLPVEKEDRIELRVAWQVAVWWRFGPAWYIYIDTTTGEQLEIEQLFDT